MTAICGIYYFEKGQIVKKDLLGKMLEAMVHRGGTQRHLYLEGNIGLACSFSNNKCSGGFHHLSDKLSDSYAIMDGTIFNSDFMTQHSMNEAPNIGNCFSDEMLIDLYQEKESDLFHKLDGVFSLGIWDGRKRRLILARDRFGVKPIYFFENKNGIVFASEIKAILAISDGKPSINLEALPEYLTFRYVAGSATMFREVKELQPGSYIIWNGSNKKERKYWSVDDVNCEEILQDSNYYLDNLDSLMRQAIKKRTKLSNKVGANCSGGIDSGLVTALATNFVEESLNTFTVGFEEREWDERYFAALTAKKYKTNHHELIIKSEKFSKQLPMLNWFNDEPLSDPNSVLVFLLAKYSKERIDLLLTGEGADEVFLGYPRYNILNIYLLSQMFPVNLLSPLISLISFLNDRRIKKLAQTFKQNQSDAIIFNSAFVPMHIVKSILNPDLVYSEFSIRHKILEDSAEKDLLLKTMMYEVKTYLVSSLDRLDKMNMACGLEACTPFLDNELFEYALKIPKTLKIKFLSNKYILRKLASKYLSPENFKMPKSGFGVPISKWFKTDLHLKRLLKDIESDSFINQVFNKNKLTQLIHDHTAYGKCDYSEILWLVTNFYIWSKEFFN